MKNALMSRFSPYSYTTNESNETVGEISSSNLIDNDNRLCTYRNFFGHEYGLLEFDHLQHDIFHTPWDNVLMHQTLNTTNYSATQPQGTQAKKRPMPFQQQLPKRERRDVPIVRRSQKLTDKITALQKLVSPYGKTDTASVLLEASVTINALQHQIQNLCRIISGQSEPNARGERRSDLQSRGLCLVPAVNLNHLKELPQYTVFSNEQY